MLVDMKVATIFLVLFIIACIVSALLYEQLGGYVYGSTGLLVGATMALIVGYSAWRDHAPAMISVFAAGVIGVVSAFLWITTPFMLWFAWRDNRTQGANA